MAYPYQSYQNPWQQGYYPMYQPMQQPVQQPVQQATQVQQPTAQPPYYTGRIWVSGRSEADAYPVAPNNAVDLWDRNGKILYKKMADATGKPIIIECDVIERAQTAPDSAHEQGGKLLDYATKDDLAAVVGVVKGFDGLIASIRSDIEKMSGDLYGIAGKKKTAKKPVEVAEDDE